MNEYHIYYRLKWGAVIIPCYKILKSLLFCNGLEAVKASIEKVTGGAADATFVNKVTSILTLENIIKQKYIALFGSLEPYNDFRRTGFPKLKPNPAGKANESGKIEIPVRLIIPLRERLYNKNTANLKSDLYTPVWWDKN